MEQKKLQAPRLIKLGACLFYEALVIIAIAFVSACAFVWIFGDATQGIKRLVFQLFIWGVIGLYFISSWITRGQTLPMRSWKLRLIRRSSQSDDVNAVNSPSNISVKTACLRYIFATLSLAFLGLGFFWRLIDSEQLFLHDRLLNTKIVTL